MLSQEPERSGLLINRRHGRGSAAPGLQDVARDDAGAHALRVVADRHGRDRLGGLVVDDDDLVVAADRHPALVPDRAVGGPVGLRADIDDGRLQGLPVDDWLKPTKEGARISVGGTGSISIFNRAAHPNASKLFINWWLSKDGQSTSMRINTEDESLRTDVPKSDVQPRYHRDPAIEYSFMDSDPQVLSREAEMLAFMKQVVDSKA